MPAGVSLVPMEAETARFHTPEELEQTRSLYDQTTNKLGSR